MSVELRGSQYTLDPVAILDYRNFEYSNESQSKELKLDHLILLVFGTCVPLVCTDSKVTPGLFLSQWRHDPGNTTNNVFKRASTSEDVQYPLSELATKLKHGKINL